MACDETQTHKVLSKHVGDIHKDSKQLFTLLKKTRYPF